MKRALLLADKSVYHYYSDFAEKEYYNRIIAGNINQVLKVDSVVCDFNAYPYRAVTYATQKIIRQSNVTERSLVTTYRLLNASRSDDNPERGFSSRVSPSLRTGISDYQAVTGHEKVIRKSGVCIETPRTNGTQRRQTKGYLDDLPPGNTPPHRCWGCSHLRLPYTFGRAVDYRQERWLRHRNGTRRTGGTADPGGNRQPLNNLIYMEQTKK